MYFMSMFIVLSWRVEWVEAPKWSYRNVLCPSGEYNRFMAPRLS